MNKMRIATWPIVLAVVVAAGASAASAGDVTVIGSLWHEQPMPSEPPVGFPEEAAAFEVDVPAEPALPNLAQPFRPFESSWYTRIDYLHWDEPHHDIGPTFEYGALYTLGFMRRAGAERFRGEMFYGGILREDGFLASDTDEVYHVTGDATQFGGRAEYEYLWDVEIESWPPFTLFVGIGTRAWKRDIFNIAADSGEGFDRWSQTWWTIYPYVGAEKHWVFPSGGEIFAAGRIGGTAVTYTHYSFAYGPAFYMNPGITGQLECGWRRNHLDFSICFEAMTWSTSSGVNIHGYPAAEQFCWPTTQMYTTGIKLGWSF